MQEKITFDKFIRWAGVAALVILVLLAIDHLSSVLLPFAIAWLLAYLLYPVVKFVQYKMRVPTRALSIVVTLVAVIAVIAFVVWLIIPPMIEQFQKLGSLVTKYIHAEAHIDSIPSAIQQWMQENQREIERFFRSKDFTEGLQKAMPQVFSVLGQTASVVISIVASLITLLYMFFILLDYEYLTENWIKIFPKKSRPFWRELMGDVERELNNYIRGQSLVALTMGILFCIGFTIIDFPMAIGLGILIGIMDLVPYLHTFALIPTALLALLKAADTGQNFWLILLAAVAVFAVVQVIIDMIVTPKIMGKAMRLNPAILLLSLSVWGALLGFIGLIIAHLYASGDDDVRIRDNFFRSKRVVCFVSARSRHGRSGFSELIGDIDRCLGHKFADSGVCRRSLRGNIAVNTIENAVLGLSRIEDGDRFLFFPFFCKLFEDVALDADRVFRQLIRDFDRISVTQRSAAVFLHDRLAVIGQFIEGRQEVVAYTHLIGYDIRIVIIAAVRIGIFRKRCHQIRISAAVAAGQRCSYQDVRAVIQRSAGAEFLDNLGVDRIRMAADPTESVLCFQCGSALSSPAVISPIVEIRVRGRVDIRSEGPDQYR